MLADLYAEPLQTESRSTIVKKIKSVFHGLIVNIIMNSLLINDTPGIYPMRTKIITRTVPMQMFSELFNKLNAFQFKLNCYSSKVCAVTKTHSVKTQFDAVSSLKQSFN